MITDAKKVDFLWKKLGFGKSKTETNALRPAPSEGVASPLLLRGDKVWNQANGIPASMPSSNAGVVTVYLTTAPTECTELAGTNPSRTWQTSLTDWIPPEFGSTYGVKVYLHTSSNAASAAASGDRFYATGGFNAGTNDEWFFDYQSGVLHFIGTNLPNPSFTGKSIYISGARYTGTIGVASLTAETGNFTFDGSAVNQDVTNADFTLGTSGTGQYIFSSNTGLVVPTGTTAERPTAQEGVIRFNTENGKYEVSQDGSTWTNLKTDQTEQDITKDVITGDGSTSSFATMTKSPSDAKNIIVYMDGVMQEATQNYTISGSTLTFSEAPHATARIVVMHGFAEEPA
jgi:hypothetical protein